MVPVAKSSTIFVRVTPKTKATFDKNSAKLGGSSVVMRELIKKFNDGTIKLNLKDEQNES